MNVTVKQYKKDTFIYLEQNKALDCFFILKQGEIKITRFHEIKGEIEEIKNDGYIFGIKQCITEIPEEERVQAITNCVVIIIQKNQIEQLYTDSPKVIMKILSEYSEILRKLDKELLEKDILLNFMRRDEVLFDIVNQYIDIKEQSKAAHLLQSYLDEPPENHRNIEKAEALLKKLPKVEFLSSNDLFDNKKIKKGQVIFVEMEMGDCFYLLRSGRARVTNIRKGKEILMAVLSEGAIFGEMAILNNKPRNATVVAETDCELSIINKRSINNLPPPLFYKILQHLTERIWITEKILFCFELHNPVARAYYLLSSKVRQNIKPKEMRDAGYVFHYKSSIEEFYNMANISDKERPDMYEFEKDENINIYENTIKVKNIKTLFDKTQFHVSRTVFKQKKR